MTLPISIFDMIVKVTVNIANPGMDVKAEVTVDNAYRWYDCRDDFGHCQYPCYGCRNDSER